MAAAEHGLPRMPTERSFGVSVGIVCLALGIVSGWRGHGVAGGALILVGFLLFTTGLVAPALLRAPNRIWWRLARILGWVNARVVLTVLFAVVLTPVGLVMRVIGRNPLHPRQSSTNWGPYPARRRDARHYEHMF